MTLCTVEVAVMSHAEFGEVFASHVVTDQRRRTEPAVAAAPPHISFSPKLIDLPEPKRSD